MELMLWLALCAPSMVSGSGADDGRYFTRFGETVLRKSQAIVLGEIDHVQPIRGGDVVRVRVIQTYKGDDTETVTLLAGRGEFFAGTQQLLFLEQYGEAGRFQYINRISRSDPDYDAKEECLNDHLRMESLGEEGLRRDAVKEFLRKGARSSQSWTRWNMLRELAYILKKYPELITEADRAELRKLAESSPDDEFRRKLLELLEEASARV